MVARIELAKSPPEPYPNFYAALGIITFSFIVFSALTVLMVAKTRSRLDVSAIATTALFEFSFLIRFLVWMTPTMDKS